MRFRVLSKRFFGTVEGVLRQQTAACWTLDAGALGASTLCERLDKCPDNVPLCYPSVILLSRVPPVTSTVLHFPTSSSTLTSPSRFTLHPDPLFMRSIIQHSRSVKQSTVAWARSLGGRKGCHRSICETMRHSTASNDLPLNAAEGGKPIRSL